jgi:hypothetical protein
MSEYENFKLDITWSLVDIKSKQPQWSDDRCDEFLADIASSIHDASINAGWEVIDALMCQEDDYKEIVDE